MTLEERSDLVLALARVLFVNGQSTDQTLAAAERLGQALGLRAKIMPRWGELQLQAAGRRRQTNLRSGGRSHRRGHGSRGFHDAGNRGPRRRPACAGSRNGGDQRDLTSAAGADVAVHVRGGGGRRGVSGDLRCPTSARGGSHIRERGGRRHSSPRLGALQRERLPATILRGVARRRYRRAGGSLPLELVTAPGRGLPMHDPGAGAACAQWRAGSHQGPHRISAPPA